VAVYARVSTDAQATKGTIGSQLEALRSHMASIGAVVVASYVDDGYSGATLDRPGLDELRDAAEAGIFDELWCLSPDRLSRSFPYQVLVLDELARLGVTVRFVDSPPIEDDPQARLLVQMQGVIAEYERYADIGIALVMPSARLCRAGGR
jgi:site-specific DNA recombinase